MASPRLRWAQHVGALALIGILLWFPVVRGARVPLLWAADLGFHELGHLLAVPLGQTTHFLAGSTTQVLVPLGLAGYFWIRQRHHIAAALMLAWAATATYDAAVYIADAPYQRLPLIGGHHDWAFLLTRWDALHRAETIASVVRLGGLLVGVAAVTVCAVPLFADVRLRLRARRRLAEATDRPVREIRWRGHH